MENNPVHTSIVWKALNLTEEQAWEIVRIIDEVIAERKAEIRIRKGDFDS